MKKALRIVLPLLFLFPIIGAAQVTFKSSDIFYAQVIGIDTCENQLIVNTVNGFAPDQEILLIQMQGATIDTSNSPAFGNVTQYGDAGNYEFAQIRSITGLRITLQNKMLRAYDFSGSFQIVTVLKTTGNAVVNSTLSPLPWNGVSGGVVAINVAGTLDLKADIDASGLGFRGGLPNQNNNNDSDRTNFYLSTGEGSGGDKGEGIAKFTPNREAGRGAQANGGGGGNGHNSGGAGGGNIGVGGGGGDQSTAHPPLANGGVGGRALAYNPNQLFMGGGGGAGHMNDSKGSMGGNGGGIILIKAGALQFSSGAALRSNGASAAKVLEEGSSGGGAAGTVALQIGAVSGPSLISLRGGNGGDNDPGIFVGLFCYGPGGGGGGGAFLLSPLSSAASFTPILAGGAAGTDVNSASPCFGSSRGAMAGSPGGSVYDHTIPMGTVSFTKPSTSPKMLTICEGDSIPLAASGGASYVWSPAASLTRNDIDKPTAFPTSSTTYLVTIKVDATCSYVDSVRVTVNKKPVITIEGPVTVCANTTTRYSFPSKPNVTPVWKATGDSTSTVKNDTLIVDWGAGTNGTIRLTLTDATTGCTATDSIAITISSFVKPNVTGLKPLCEGDTLTLTADPGYASYKWTNGDLTQSTRITKAGIYSVEVTVAAGCTGSSDPLTVIVNPLPTPTINASLLLLPATNGSSTLTVGGGTFSTLLWSTGAAIDSITVTDSGTYTVTVIDSNGCSATASIYIGLDFGAPSIEVKLDTFEAAPGDHVTFPFHIVTSQNMPLSGATDYIVKLTFNTSLIAPAKPTDPSIKASVINGTLRTITITGTKDVAQTNGEFPGVEFIAALGDATETTMTIDSFAFTNGSKAVTVTKNDGLLRIIKICKEGGTRLFSVDGKILLSTSHPNPASGYTTISYSLIEEGRTKLFITDMLGRIVKTLVNDEMKAGDFTETLDLTGFTPGMYCYILQTPSQLMRRTLLIQH